VYEAAIAIQNIYYQCCVTNNTASSMAQNITSDFLSALFSVPLILIVVVGYIKSKKRATLQFLILFYLLSYFPFINIERGSAYLDSRYMYISSAIGVVLILNSLSELLLSIRRKSIQIILTGMLTVLIGFLMIIHIKIDRNTMRVLTFQSQEQLSVLHQIKQLVPKLPVKPVFYIETNKEDTTQPLPFQQGVGHTLMVWYADDLQVPRPLLASYFLWGIKDQGYKDLQTYGFGYYRDLKDLQDAVIVNRIQKEQIIGLYYEADNKKIINITTTVIEKLY
jgi:hypothetical protein